MYKNIQDLAAAVSVRNYFTSLSDNNGFRNKNEAKMVEASLSKLENKINLSFIFLMSDQKEVSLNEKEKNENEAELHYSTVSQNFTPIKEQEKNSLNEREDSQRPSFKTKKEKQEIKE